MITSHNRPGLPDFSRATLKNMGRPGYEAIGTSMQDARYMKYIHDSFTSEFEQYTIMHAQ